MSSVFPSPDKPIVVTVPDKYLPKAWREESVGKCIEDGATIDNMDPSRPFLVLDKFDWDKLEEWIALKSAWISKQLPNDIIIRDPTPKVVQEAFFDISPRLNIVLEKDSVRCFLRLFVECAESMVYRCSITSETLTYMVRHDALRCAKVVLEGKSPELGSTHANPNCINPYGCFPLHEAAERFSVDMIQLLFRHGASANVRTVSDAGIQGLLPLHVAVENACMHKYLEDNLSPMQYDEDYIYKLIHLLCLPEMKVFLDTIRVLAGKTDNLVDELWNYMKNGKLVQTAVLLLAAQKHIRNIKPDGFSVITEYLLDEYDSIICNKGDTGKAQKQVEERKALLKCKRQLYSIISLAGEVLDNYIQAHSELSHAEVLAHVSSVLKKVGFCPKEEYIDNINLCPNICKISFSDLINKGHTDATKAVALASAAEKKTVKKRALRGWDPTYTRRKFLPYWRSVLRDYPAADDKSVLDLGQLCNSMSNQSLSPNHNIGLLGRLQHLASTHQSRRYSTDAFKMLRKVLKNA